jgi:putative methyltransferase (TIGR04325 family)
VSGVPLGARARLFVKGLTPPYLWGAAKWTKDRALGRKPGAVPKEESLKDEPHAAPEPEPPPEWEYVPEGWQRQVGGWSVDTVADAYAAKWPSYVEALDGPGPLGLNHEVRAGEPVDRLNHESHNTIVSFAYVLALAARNRNELSILDWGGGLAHYEPLSRTLVPDVELAYHCKEVEPIAARGRELSPHIQFHTDDSCLDRRYDLVLASSSLHYVEDWPSLLAKLAGATGDYLFVTRLPVALDSDSFVVLQRAHAYGYDTEYLGWVVNRAELVRRAVDADLELVREFLLSAWFSASGAPEDPVEHRGYLFRRRG